MNEQSIQYIRRFGYSAEEAHFLCLAALHSGYFVSRQFTDFIHRSRGASTQRFLDKLALHSHARCERYQGKRLVYHIRAQSIYSRLGQVDNRNRRNKAPLTIKRRLMCLDFVLSHPDYRFLDTEAEKIDYLLIERQIPIDLLPARRFQSHSTERVAERFFVDKQPIYLKRPVADDSVPIVGFAYIDEGARTIQGFETFLVDLQPLCDTLRRFEIVYVASDTEFFGKAEAAFYRVFVAHTPAPAPDADLSLHAREIVEHFEIRRMFDDRNFAGLTNDRLVEYRRQKEKFAGEHFDRLYQRWKDDGAAALVKHSGAARDPRFQTQLLTADYDMFRSSQYAMSM